jgi:hypothetical protein
MDCDAELDLEPLLLLLPLLLFLLLLPFELFELTSELRLALTLDERDSEESMVLLAATSLTLPEELSSRILRSCTTESRASIGARGLASATQATAKTAKRRESELLKRMLNERKSSVGKPKK